jgi:2-polyprenyl-3-methyl-5-hydroxy-6-metoxy-1,4-benzoquinol methylase
MATQKSNNTTKKFKGYDVIDAYPEDGWLKGYFYARRNDIKGTSDNVSESYRDLGYLKHKDYILHLLDIKQGERVLDVGCADGAMMVYCGLQGAEVYGVDLSPEFIDKANQYLKRFSIKGAAKLCDVRKTEFPDGYFDKVISGDFFEHLSLEDNISALKEIKRVLKPGGVFVIKTPNLTYLRFSRFFKQIIQIIRLKNPLDVIIPHTQGDSPQHIGLTTKGRMARVIRAAGFMNFKFHYDANSKLERRSHAWAELFAEVPLLRDIFTEELIVVVYKPVILSLFP